MSEIGVQRKIALDSGTLISAFSEDQVERLTGITKSQLRYWDRTGFFTPAFGAENRRVALSRIYSFRDVASLRVLNMLRNSYGIPLQQLRKVAVELGHLADEKWTATSLYVLNRKVVFAEPNTQRLREILFKQYVLPIPLRVVVEDTREAVKQLARRDDKDIGQIRRNRNVSHNAPVVAGTRIPVRVVQRFIDAGYSNKKILDEYPSLTPADLEAVRKLKAA
ncbi:MAG TPA: DUF433 domain-containing protein [Reyranella sp.]